MGKYKKGDVVSGYVTGIEKYGIFLNIDENNCGLIHISEISNNYVRNIHDYVKQGELIRARVIEEADDGQIKLSIKDLDYRITKKKSEKIEETKSGFSTLFLMLNKWVDDKITEILKKDKKN